MLSEGRGTTRPFELVGAPWIEAERFARDMNALGLTGVHFRPAVFEPTFQKHAKQACGGCQIHVTARHLFKPVLVGVALTGMFWRTNPSKFAWRQPPYEYEHDKVPDRHPGRIGHAAKTDRVRRAGDGDCGGLEGRRGGVQKPARTVPAVPDAHAEACALLAIEEQRLPQRG